MLPVSLLALKREIRIYLKDQLIIQICDSPASLYHLVSGFTDDTLYGKTRAIIDTHHNHLNGLPPSTGIIHPVLKVSVVATAYTALATSSGVAKRPNGVASSWVCK